MPGSWASRPRRAAAALAAVLLLLAAGPAAARVHVGVRSPGARVTVSGRGVDVTLSGDSSGDSTHVSVNGTDVNVDDNGTVRLFADVHVPAGQRVEGDAVAIFGSVRVEGEVTGGAVAILGTVTLAPTARVDGDAVSIGGQVTARPGAHVGGETVSVGFLPVLTLGLPGVPVVIACVLLGWLISVFFGWFFALLFPDRLARVAATSSQRTAASLALGFLSGPLCMIAGLVLLVTLIGIPIAFLLPFVYVAVVYAGQLAATYVLGCKLTRRRPGVGGVTAPLVAGTGFVAAFFVVATILWGGPNVVGAAALFFLLVGALLLVGLSCLGTGAFLLSRAGSRPRELPGAPALGGGAAGGAGPMGPAGPAPGAGPPPGGTPAPGPAPIA